MPIEEDEALIHGPCLHVLMLHDGHRDGVELLLLTDSLAHVREDDVI